MEIYLPLLVQGLAIGVLTGILYVLVALGLTLIYGILHIVNFAHGEIYMLGAMAVFYLHVLGGLPLVPTLAAIGCCRSCSASPWSAGSFAPSAASGCSSWWPLSASRS